MRRISLALLACGACNWVWGIDKTSELPADGVTPNSVLLTWAATNTKPDGSPDPALAFIAFGSEPGRTEKPRIQVGPPVGMGDLVDVPYKDGGVIEIPFKLAGQAWRLVYTLPGESVPTEMQTTLQTAALVVPRTTRPSSPVPPAGSGYRFTPMNHTYPISNALLMTTGDFSSTLLGTGDTDGSNMVTFGYAAKAQPLAGPLGTPSVANHDYVVLGEIAALDSDHSAITAMTTTQIDLAAGALSMPATAPTTVTTAHPMINGVDVNATLTQMRMNNVVSSLPNVGPFAWRVQYGISPSLAQFGFVPGGAPDYLETPLILATDIWTNPTLYFGGFVGFDVALPYPKITYVALVSPRVVNGVTLTSALQMIWPKGPENSGENNAASIKPTIQPASLATNEHLGSADISHADGTMVTRAQPLPFTWTLEGAQGISTDTDYVVTVFEIMGSQLVPKRTYRVTTTSVDVDTSELVTGHTYVISVTSHAGLPMTRVGDYRMTAPDHVYGSATKFSGTFVIN